MKYVDQIHDYKGQWDVPSRCGLKIVRKHDRDIVIATELFEENPGTSITNVSAQLAADIVHTYGLDPGRLLFIEHCSDRGSRLEHFRESFDIVHLKWDGTRFGDPDWESISRERVDEMIRD